MLTNKIMSLVIVFFGFFLMPSSTFACAKRCCKVEVTKKVEKKSCCDKDENSKHKNGCSGKCKNPTCTASTPIFNFIEPTSVSLTLDFEEPFFKEQSFSSQNFTLNSGFLSIWTPPNIR